MAHEGNAPEWSQFQGGPGHPGSLEDGPEPPYKMAWTFLGPEGAVSGAVITGDVAIAVGAHAVYGLDLTDGAELWRLARNGGPLSIPAVGSARGRQILVFLDESAGAGTSLVGVDLGDRHELWRTKLKTSSRSGVAIDGPTAFVADDDGNVYAVDLKTGTQLWTVKAPGQVLVPPAVSDGNVYVVARDVDAQRSQLVAIEEQSGRRAWEPFSAPVVGSTGSGPAAADGVVVAGFADRVVRALPARGGEPRWGELALSVFSPAGAPAFQPGDVYVADVSGGLYRLNAESGERDWDYQFNELVVRSSPVVSAGTVLLGLNDGRLVAVDVRSGELVWQSAAGQGLIGAIALSHEVAVAVRGGRHPGLVAFEHDPAGSLLHIPSPTVVDPARLLGNYVIALAIAFALIFAPFRILSSRVRASRFADDGEGESEAE